VLCGQRQRAKVPARLESLYKTTVVKGHSQAFLYSSLEMRTFHLAIIFSAISFVASTPLTHRALPTPVDGPTARQMLTERESQIQPALSPISHPSPQLSLRLTQTTHRTFALYSRLGTQVSGTIKRSYLQIRFSQITLNLLVSGKCDTRESESTIYYVTHNVVNLSAYSCPCSRWDGCSDGFIMQIDFRKLDLPL